MLDMFPFAIRRNDEVPVLRSIKEEKKEQKMCSLDHNDSLKTLIDLFF